MSSRLVMGVLRTVREVGISIPGDLALAGYGDPDWFAIWGPGITTFAQPLADMGAQAAEKLLELISGNDLPLTAGSTAGGFSIVEHLLAPKELAARLHMHSREDEFTVVIKGHVWFPSRRESLPGRSRRTGPKTQGPVAYLLECR